jgi:hypothetical protein
MSELAIRYVANPFVGILKSIYSILESSARARAASTLAQQGQYEAARRLMMGEDK